MLNLLPISQDEINSILWKACDTFRVLAVPTCTPQGCFGVRKTSFQAGRLAPA